MKLADTRQHKTSNDGISVSELHCTNCDSALNEIVRGGSPLRYLNMCVTRTLYSVSRVLTCRGYQGEIRIRAAWAEMGWNKRTGFHCVTWTWTHGMSRARTYRGCQETHIYSPLSPRNVVPYAYPLSPSLSLYKVIYFLHSSIRFPFLRIKKLWYIRYENIFLPRVCSISELNLFSFKNEINV